MTALRKRQSALLVVLASVLLGSGAVVQAGETERVSVDSAGTQGNISSFAPVALSANGPVVAFDSDASNLMVGNTNGFTDTFVHMR